MILLWVGEGAYPFPIRILGFGRDLTAYWSTPSHVNLSALPPTDAPLSVAFRASSAEKNCTYASPANGIHFFRMITPVAVGNAFRTIGSVGLSGQPLAITDRDPRSSVGGSFPSEFGISPPAEKNQDWKNEKLGKILIPPKKPQNSGSIGV